MTRPRVTPTAASRPAPRSTRSRTPGSAPCAAHARRTSSRTRTERGAAAALSRAATDEFRRRRRSNHRAHTSAGERSASWNVSYPGESAEYRAARDRLLEREAALRRLTEEEAAARRALPPGGLVPEDYVFEEAGPDGAPRPRALSELFAPGHDSLAVYSFMFPRSPGHDGPCPSCTQFLDSFDRVAHHAAQRVSVAVVATAPVERLTAHARSRGWRHLRLLSVADTSYQRDHLAEDADGAQLPMLNVFRR